MTTTSYDIEVPQMAGADLMLSLAIPDIATVYGGIRGRTMSSRHQLYAWPVMCRAGLHTIIDLRADGDSSKMPQLCSHYGLHFFSLSHRQPLCQYRNDD